MTGSGTSDEVFQKRLQQARRKRTAGIAGIVVLLLVLLAFLTPWLRGTRQISSGPRAVARMRVPGCWDSWVVEADGTTWSVAAPDSWVGSTELPGEVADQGDHGPMFFTLTGEQYRLSTASVDTTCAAPPTTSLR